jgi:tetratricopeptide (TPR) repeat protein
MTTATLNTTTANTTTANPTATDTTAINDLLRSGIHAHQQGDLAEAARLYQAALDLDTDNASAHNNLGFVHGQQQQWPEALAHLRTALRLNPVLDMAHSNLGQVLVATGHTESGLEHLQEAVRVNPANILAWDNLARIRLLTGQFEGAEYACLRALKLQPDDPRLLTRLLTRLGTALAAQTRYPEALQCYQQALTCDSQCAEAWAQLGITHLLGNDLGSARDALSTALELNPADTSARRHLALTALALGQHRDASAHFEQMLLLQPDDSASRLDLAVIYLARKQYAQAHSHLQQCDPGTRISGKYRYYLGVVLTLLGEAETGRQILQALAADATAGAYTEKSRQFLHAN